MANGRKRKGEGREAVGRVMGVRGRACTPWMQDPEAADSAMREVDHSLLSALLKRNCDPFAIRGLARRAAPFAGCGRSWRASRKTSSFREKRLD